MDSIQDLYQSYRSAESAWIQSLSETSHHEALASPSSIQDCSLHYGELAFLLVGLKPCVLIQLPTSGLTLDLYRQVLESQWMQRASFKEQHQSQALGLNCQLIVKNVRSPEMPLQGCILVWSDKTVQSHQQSERIRRGISLLCSPEDQQNSNNQKTISEQDLAVMLDIPGRLPESEMEMQKMIEVSYWHQGDDTTVSGGQNDGAATHISPTLLTAFAAQPDQLPNIQIHFKRYKDIVRNIFGIQLKLHIQSMADLQ
ncbi:hypothetical protein BGZ49_002064 [Haplosporangium sp. Z 27]|nr:hypothetical protein BGZ49_002064 [Haplosporangium sp. Z 27]